MSDTSAELSASCVFCKIIAGEIPAEKLYEDEQTFAFLDIRPNNPGHTLVLPKHHYRNIFDSSESNWLAVMRTVRLLAPAIRTASGMPGINIIVNNEKEAHQEVFHSHVHIIPRREGDGLRSWVGTAYESPEAAAAMAEKIREAQKIRDAQA